MSLLETPANIRNNTFSRISTADTNAAVVSARGSGLISIYASNINAAARYLKIYDKATAPTVGTDTPTFRILVPGGSTGGLSTFYISGAQFYNGIGIAITTGSADSDTGAVAAGDLIVNMEWV